MVRGNLSMRSLRSLRLEKYVVYADNEEGIKTPVKRLSPPQIEKIRGWHATGESLDKIICGIPESAGDIILVPATRLRLSAVQKETGPPRIQKGPWIHF